MSRESPVVEVDQLQDLLLATARGDRSAFRCAYKLSSPQLYPIALRLLSRRDAADDAIQEAFVLIWRKAALYRPEKGRPLAWMATIVRNCAIDRLRREAREPHDLDSWEEVAESKIDPIFKPATLSQPSDPGLMRCLGELKENQRHAILLAYYHGMTHEELAAKLDAPIGTVKSWVRRGLLQLRDCLES